MEQCHEVVVLYFVQDSWSSNFQSVLSMDRHENLKTTKIITYTEYLQCIGIRFKKLDSIFNMYFQSWIQYHHVPEKVRVQW